jgi:hypothetical protein
MMTMYQEILQQQHPDMHVKSLLSHQQQQQQPSDQNHGGDDQQRTSLLPSQTDSNHDSIECTFTVSPSGTRTITATACHSIPEVLETLSHLEQKHPQQHVNVLVTGSLYLVNIMLLRTFD